MNTYGLHSINNTTFNVRDHDNLSFPKFPRDIIYTLLKVNNLVFNVLGYMRFAPVIPIISGCLRMSVGVGIVVTTLLIGDRKAQYGSIIGHWYNEALLTGITQFARGLFEAFVPYGWAVNLALDGVATIINIVYELDANTPRNSDCAKCVNDDPSHRPYKPHMDPQYDSGSVYYISQLI